MSFRKVMPLMTMAVVLLSIPAAAEQIFLRNGNIFEGKILSDTAAATVVQTEDGTKKAVEKQNITRVFYGHLSLGKAVIRMNNGEELQGYKVDENRDYYTFRKKLYTPVEFKVKKSDVVFVTETNPTELSGLANNKNADIELSWFPPYYRMRRYIVYIRADKEKSFREAGSTRWCSYTVSGLTKDTRYRFAVKAVDTAGDLSLASNEISVIAGKAPAKPKNLKGSMTFTKENDLMDVALAWEAPANNSGSVYSIYHRTPNGYAKIDETDKTNYIVKGVIPDATRYYSIRSKDNDGNESFGSNIYNTRIMKLNFIVRPVLVCPIGDFGKLNGIGGGIMVDSLAEDVFLDHFMGGLSFGYWYLTGNQEAVNYTSSIPLTAKAGYRMNVLNLFDIIPSVSIGFSYNTVSYDNTGLTGIPSLKDKKSKSELEPVVMAGFMVPFPVYRNIFAGAGLEYGTFFEDDGQQQFLCLSIECGIRF